MSRHVRFAVIAFSVMVGLSLAAADAQDRRPPQGRDGQSRGDGGGERVAQPRDGGSARAPEARAEPQRRAVPARPAPRRPSRPGTSYVFVGGYFYDPFYGPYPWWARSSYPYGYYPYFDDRASIRVQATPRDAAVYVDGFYAGIVDDFDGVFQRLPLTPGGHSITLYLDGYRTVQRNLYLQPGSSMKLHETLERLPPGARSERPRLAPALPAPPDGSYTAPRGAAPRGLSPPPLPPVSENGSQAEGFGTLSLHVQPAEAEVSIDGQRWLSSGAGEFEVQVPAGRHTVEVVLQGYQRFASEIDVRDGESTPLNVSLSRGR